MPKPKLPKGRGRGYALGMNRLERVREVVDRILLEVQDAEGKRCGFVHLYGVSQSAAFLALQRGLNSELAAIAGMLHDIATYESGNPANHGPRSAERAVGILQELDAFSPEEIAEVQNAVARHSDKSGRHHPFAELLKDADVLQHFLYNPSVDANPGHVDRRARLMDLYAR